MLNSTALHQLFSILLCVLYYRSHTVTAEVIALVIHCFMSEACASTFVG
jgi:hypothetical protein